MPFSKAHYRAVSPASDTPADIADRKARNEAGRLALADRRALYPFITDENANAAIDYQESRYRFHYNRGRS